MYDFLNEAGWPVPDLFQVFEIQGQKIFRYYCTYNFLWFISDIHIRDFQALVFHYYGDIECIKINNSKISNNTNLQAEVQGTSGVAAELPCAAAVFPRLAAAAASSGCCCSQWLRAEAWVSSWGCRLTCCCCMRCQ